MACNVGLRWCIMWRVYLAIWNFRHTLSCNIMPCARHGAPAMLPPGVRNLRLAAHSTHQQCSWHMTTHLQLITLRNSSYAVIQLQRKQGSHIFFLSIAVVWFLQCPRFIFYRATCVIRSNVSEPKRQWKCKTFIVEVAMIKAITSGMEKAKVTKNFDISQVRRSNSG